MWTTYQIRFTDGSGREESADLFNHLSGIASDLAGTEPAKLDSHLEQDVLAGEIAVQRVC
jgi:hypothetical protein